jgi:hypothetical protein
MHGRSTRRCPSGWSANTAAENFFGVLKRKGVNRSPFSDKSTGCRWCIQRRHRKWRVKAHGDHPTH